MLARIFLSRNLCLHPIAVTTYLTIISNANVLYKMDFHNSNSPQNISYQHFKHLTLGSIFADFEIQVAFKQMGTYYNITYIQTKENPEDKISVRLHCKSHQKSSKWQNLFTG